jgi:Flp pilus assembly protein TadG
MIESRSRRVSIVNTEVDDTGAVAVIVALAISTFLLGMAAFAVDFGNAFARRTDLQGMADDAARAGAGWLPDQSAARAAVINNLCAQPAGWTGWLHTHCNDASPDLPGTVVDFLDENGDPVVAGGVATRIAVHPPQVAVNFTFGQAIGASGTTLHAQATARIGTPTGLGVLPFYLTPSDLATTGNTFCNSFGQSARRGPPCGRGTERGGLTVPRYRSTTALMTTNIKRGLQPTLHNWQNWPLSGAPRTLASPKTECKDLADTVLPVANPFEVDVNCVTVDRADDTSTDELDGFFDSSGERGRAYRLCNGGQAGTIHGTHTGVDVTPLFQNGSPLVNSLIGPATGTPTALDASITGSSPPTPAQAGWIKQSIFSCPRLALLPVIDAGIPVDTDSHSYPILDFRYVWIDSTTSDHGFLFSRGGRPIGVKGFIIPNGYLPTWVSTSPNVGPYLGPGWPRQVVMMK